MTLHEQELQEPRSAADFLTWVLGKMDSYAAVGTLEWENLYFKRGPAKVLVDELLPLGLFAKHHFKLSPNVSIKPILGSQNYDAKVEYGSERGNTIEYIEVTQASEREKGKEDWEYWRKVILRREGYVNPVGSVIKSKQGVTVQRNRGTRAREFFRGQELRFISEAATKKAAKPYPAKTALVILFNDSRRVIRDEDDLTFLEHNFRKEVLPKLSNFVLVGLVGESGQHYLEF